MTDVWLFHSADGGEIEVVGGRMTMSDGAEASAYLSLLGGNERDDGSQATAVFEWWGNKSERVAARRYRSEFQYLLITLPPIPANLLRLEEAATRDLAWMVDTGFASFVGATVTMPALNTVRTDVRIEIDDRTFNFFFTASWRARQQGTG